LRRSQSKISDFGPLDPIPGGDLVGGFDYDRKHDGGVEIFPRYFDPPPSVKGLKPIISKNPECQDDSRRV